MEWKGKMDKAQEWDKEDELLFELIVRYIRKQIYNWMNSWKHGGMDKD